MKQGNLFEGIPGSMPEELVEELVEVLAEGEGKVRVERIVSRGHSSPEGFWYDQAAEWVCLLKGAAVLTFEGDKEPVDMKPGDWIEIPAHCRHRVERTDGEEETVWLAVHWG